LGPAKRKKNPGALGTCPVCPLVKTALIKLRRRQEEREQVETAAEKMKHCLIFSREIFYITIVVCLNILRLKAVSEISARQRDTN